MPFKTRLDDLGIVHHQKVARTQKVENIREMQVFQYRIRHVQEARSRAVRERKLRNQFGRKVKIVVGQMLSDEIIGMKSN